MRLFWEEGWVLGGERDGGGPQHRGFSVKLKMLPGNAMWYHIISHHIISCHYIHGRHSRHSRHHTVAMGGSPVEGPGGQHAGEVSLARVPGWVCGLRPRKYTVDYLARPG